MRAVTLKMADRRPAAKRYWATPPKLMALLQERFAFDCDPCPNPRPPEYDGLKAPWGQRNWVNPPFGVGISAWCERAITEAQRGALVVLAIPAYKDHELARLWRAGAVFEAMGVVRWIELDDGSIRPEKARSLTLLCILDPPLTPREAW